GDVRVHDRIAFHEHWPGDQRYGAAEVCSGADECEECDFGRGGVRDFFEYRRPSGTCHVTGSVLFSRRRQYTLMPRSLNACGVVIEPVGLYSGLRRTAIRYQVEAAGAGR